VPPGQLEAWTGITERRWWDANHSLSDGAIAAARKALTAAGMKAEELEVLIYAGVCREQFEPATACSVASALGVSPDAAVYDISNACLGVLNGIVDIANRIELGQCRAGMVVACETAREINETMIAQMLRSATMDTFRTSVATLTGGSGAVAVIVTDGSFNSPKSHKLLGGATQTAPQHFGLCRWGLQAVPTAVQQFLATDAPALFRSSVDFGLKHCVVPFMSTDAVAVLRYGVDLGLRTWNSFMTKVGWVGENVDKVICHQVGAGHRDAVLRAIGISPDKDYSTFPFLGNIGTVSLPLTAALAEEREFLRPGDRVGFLGIGSGLNCMMLGLQW
jgi:3-oxoacyl-[acyl-carrier-protein] synthase-3